MWYLARIVLAQPEEPGRSMYTCESFNVLFEADNARTAYDKAVAWGRHEVVDSDGMWEFLGVSHLATVGEQLGEGVDLGGHVFRRRNVWTRRMTWIPEPGELGAIQTEENGDRPIVEVLGEKRARELFKILDEMLWKKPAQ